MDTFQEMIPNTDFFVAKTSTELSIYSTEGDLIANLPYEFTQKEAIFWGEAYAQGYKSGVKWGEELGEFRIQQEMLKLLGIDQQLNGIVRDIKSLASALRRHDSSIQEDGKDLEHKKDSSPFK